MSNKALLSLCLRTMNNSLPSTTIGIGGPHLIVLTPSPMQYQGSVLILLIIGMFQSEVTEEEISAVARDIQNRLSRRVGAESMERRCFREFFGTSISIACLVWHLLLEHNRLPENGEIKHLLWTLFFLKVYPKQGPACSVVGASKGAINPKTFRKWVWKFCEAIAELHVEVVSF